jgi:hypothetical protein
MALASRTPYVWDDPMKPIVEDWWDGKIYRIVHLRDAYFLDNMCFKGRKAAEDYLQNHMCKVASHIKSEQYSVTNQLFPENLSAFIEEQKEYFFDIVEN